MVLGDLPTHRFCPTPRLLLRGCQQPRASTLHLVRSLSSFFAGSMVLVAPNSGSSGTSGLMSHGNEPLKKIDYSLGLCGHYLRAGQMVLRGLGLDGQLDRKSDHLLVALGPDARHVTRQLQRHTGIGDVTKYRSNHSLPLFDLWPWP